MSNKAPESSPTKDELTKLDPVGWYMCQIGSQLVVLHWDGQSLDDTLPHYDNNFTRTRWKYAKNFKGPMCFVDIDFPPSGE